MNKLVIYGSIYGATKDYANELANSIDANIVSIKDIDANDLDAFDVIVIGSGIYASGLVASKKIHKILKNYKDKNKKFIVYTVGIADPKNNAKHLHDLVYKQLPKEECATFELFHLRGCLDYSKLSLKHKIMMFMLKQMIKHKKQKTIEDEYILKTYGSVVNFVDFDTLKPIVDSVNAFENSKNEKV